MISKKFWLEYLSLVFFLLHSPLAAESKSFPLKVISFDYPPYIFVAPTPLGRGLEVDTLLKALEGSPFRPAFAFYPLKRAIQIQSNFKENDWPIYVGAWNHFNELPARRNLTPIQIGSGSFFAYARAADTGKYRKIRKLSDLAKISVAAPRGSSIVAALRNLGIEPLEVSTFDQLFKVLALRRVELAIVLELAGDHYLKKRRFNGTLRRLDYPIFEITTDIIVPNDHPNAQALIQTLTSRVSHMRNNGDLKMIAEKYYGAGQVPKYFWNLRK